MSCMKSVPRWLLKLSGGETSDCTRMGIQSTSETWSSRKERVHTIFSQTWKINQSNLNSSITNNSTLFFKRVIINFSLVFKNHNMKFLKVLQNYRKISTKQILSILRKNFRNLKTWKSFRLLAIKIKYREV